MQRFYRSAVRLRPRWRWSTARRRRAGRRLSAKPIVFIVPLHCGRHHRSGGAPRARSGPAVIVENRPGAGGNIGMDAVLAGAGRLHHRLRAISNALNPFVYPSMPLDPTATSPASACWARPRWCWETAPRSRSTAQGSGRLCQHPAPRSHAGNGHVDASGGRDVRSADRRRHAAHSLQGQRARHQRSAGRPSAHHVRQPAGLAAAYQVGQVARWP